MPRQKALSTTVHQLKITLKGIRPPIWRRVVVSSSTTLHELHLILQTVMGWTNSHLHQFIIGDQVFGDPEVIDEMEVQSERRATLGRVAGQVKARFLYEYDFGDSWKHEILVEKIEPAGPGAKHPVCLGGKRACPPEDCGGAWGYADLVQTISDPDHPEYEEQIDQLGGGYDPEGFDMDHVNRCLGIAPGSRSMHLLH